MINCKEDLLLTRFRIRSEYKGELLDGAIELLTLCEKYNIGIFGDKPLSLAVDDIKQNGEAMWICISNEAFIRGDGGMMHPCGLGFDIPSSFKRLTPADFKPKTKVEHVKCDDSLFSLKPNFDNGELFVQRNSDEWVVIHDEHLFARMFYHDCIYRRVETEVTWHDELDDFLKLNNIHSSERISMIPCDKFIEMCHLVSNANK